MTGILKSDEIKEILADAMDMAYRQPLVYFPSFHKTQIFKISAKGLILVLGNSDTGMKHIMERHGFLSERADWDKNGNLLNPTKFSLAPIEYLSVADHIYCTDNLGISSHEHFTLYEGIFIGSRNKSLKYRLVLYKGTSIIHTFYMVGSKEFTRKRALNQLRQGAVSSTHDLISDTKVYSFSYYASDGTEHVRVFATYDFGKNKCKWEIAKVVDGTTPASEIYLVMTEPIPDNHNDLFALSLLGHQEGRMIEKEIKRIFGYK